MPRVALTDLFIRNLKPTGAQHRFYCNQLHNFGLRLSQAGGKTFFLDVGEPRTRISLGKYPKTPLKDARKKALQILWSDEPLPSTRTLADAFEAYYEGHISRNCRPATARKLKKLISTQLPHLADRAIASITARDLSSVIEGYADRPAAANRLHAVLSAFFRWTQRNEYITRSPLTFPRPHKHQPRDRVLSERSNAKNARPASRASRSIQQRAREKRRFARSLIYPHHPNPSAPFQAYNYAMSCWDSLASKATPLPAAVRRPISSRVCRA
jgi:Arm DNA-binding domain